MIGVITIGQAPRNDITASMFEDSFIKQTLQFGALDGLAMNQIEALAPGPNGTLLVTRLADGTEVVLGKDRVTPHMQGAIDRAIEAGASVICVLCTGAFNGLTASVPIVYPDKVVKGVVDALLPTGRLGVLIPHEDQREAMTAKWSTSQRDVVAGAVSPYTNTDALLDVARRVCAIGADVLVMDCMGFTREMERDVRAVANGVPVVLSNGVVGAVIAEAWGLRSARNDASTIEEPH